MGLDQHAHLRNHKVDWDKYYSDNEEESKKEHEQVFVWRKHARLQQFMSKEVGLNKTHFHTSMTDMLSHLGFNG